MFPVLLRALGLFFAVSLLAAEKPFHRAELIFPQESWHNHSSCIVEAPDGDLFVTWFHGSGERKADDVRVEAARLKRGKRAWSPRFTLADTPGYPDCNPLLHVDDRGRLWLFHTTILANLWESALLKSYVSSDWRRTTPPKWDRAEVLHITPGPEFDAAISNALPRLKALADGQNWPEQTRREVDDFLNAMRDHAGDKLYRRLGWMGRSHPTVIGDRWLLPLYHDGFSFCLVAISDDRGATWRPSAPIIGAGNIQACIVPRRDGSLVAYMRDNGPPPKRLQVAESRDRGETWTAGVDSEIPNPGSGADVIALRDGTWAYLGNDTEKGRHSLAVWLSDDEGRSWKVRRHLELAEAEAGSSFGYPSLIQSRDGSLHASYSFHEKKGGAIKHAHFNAAWVRQSGCSVR
jgi:predicted neuraminidase